MPGGVTRCDVPAVDDGSRAVPDRMRLGFAVLTAVGVAVAYSGNIMAEWMAQSATVGLTGLVDLLEL